MTSYAGSEIALFGILRPCRRRHSRKLAASDRLTGAAASVLDSGGKPYSSPPAPAAALTAICAAARAQNITSKPLSSTPLQSSQPLPEKPPPESLRAICPPYSPILQNSSDLSELIRAADELRENAVDAALLERKRAKITTVT